jgi:hypothetical protein
MHIKRSIYWRPNYWGIILTLMAVATLCGCTLFGWPASPSKETTDSHPRMVIVSLLGELSREACYVGDTIHYRIKFSNKVLGGNPLIIVCQLDPNLKFLNAKQAGIYSQKTHSVIWKLKTTFGSRVGHVEFTGTAAKPANLTHSAKLIAGKHEAQTNKVQSIVCEKPQLGWISLLPKSDKSARPTAYIKDESTTGLLINFDLPGLFTSEQELEGRVWHRLILTGHQHLSEIGSPELPMVGQIVEVPFGVNISVGIEQAEFVQLGCYNVLPSQQPPIWAPATTTPKFELNISRYTDNTLYPGTISRVTAEDIGIVRGRRLVMLKAFPIQYNPVTREMQAYTKLEVRLKYNQPAQIEPVDTRLLSNPFEEMFDAAILNYKNNDRFGWGTAGSEEKSGADYLILAHSNFINPPGPDDPLEKFRVWKQRKGWLTRIVDVANIQGGATCNNIETYLQNAYSTWDPAPAYVLLVGDDDLVPTCHRTNHPDHGTTQIATDLYYAAVDGSDYFPDMFMGRWTVSSVPQLAGIVQKLIDYEQNPPGNANFYTDMQLVMLFEDDPIEPNNDPFPQDGTEDTGFAIIETSEPIRNYLMPIGYNAQRIYNQSSDWPAMGGGPGPERYVNMDPLPIDLIGAADAALGIPGFPWDGDTADIQIAINNGSFLVVYAGHGNVQGWANPAFDLWDAMGLANPGRPPVVFSWSCSTGWFDDATNTGTDAIAAGTESFCETLLTTAGNGAVAAIGSSRISYDTNLLLMDGATRALWPGYLPTPGTSRLLRFGQVLNYAKLYMAGLEADPDIQQMHFESYHLFGDPEMPIWTTEPRRLSVEHPQTIGSTGLQEFVVKVQDSASGDPVPNATVTLTRNSNIVHMLQTDPAGLVRFELNAPAPETLDITVTVYDYLPYMATIDVSADGAELNRLDPLHGPEGQLITIGGRNYMADREVRLFFGDSTVGTQTTSAAGSFGQSGDVTITVPRPYPLGPENISAIDSADRHAVRVFQVRGSDEIDVYTYDQYNSSTWHMHPGEHPTWNNPEIQLYDDAGIAVESDNLEEGKTYTIRVRIYNDTDFDANNVQVTFKWANYGLGQPFELIGPTPSVTIDVPKNDSAFAENTWSPQATGHICIQVETYHVEDINPDNNLGQENCHVGTSNSPYKIPFQVCNPTDQASAMFLEIRQLSPKSDQEHPPWATWLNHPNPQVLEPGDCREATAFVDPDPAKAKPGDIAEFALTGFAGRQMIGGVNFIVEKK